MSIRTLSAYLSILCVACVVEGCSSDDDSKGGGSDDAGSDSASGGTTGTGGSTSSGGTASGGTASGGSSGSGGTGTGTDAGDAGVLTIEGTVVDATNFTAATNFDYTKYPKLAGIKVCVYGDSSVPCATTDANGLYSFTGGPVDTAFYLSFEGKDGSGADLQPTLYAVAASAAGSTLTPPAILMTTKAFSDSWGAQGGVTADATKGIILFGATTLEASATPFHEMFGTTELYYLEGFSVTISPAAAAGPVYTSAAWAPDASLTSSSAAGWGFFLAAPGDYTLTITRPNMTCGSVTTKVVAGYSTTYVGTLCNPITDGGTTDAGGNDAASDATAD